jgi:hypothetical protein
MVCLRPTPRGENRANRGKHRTEDTEVTEAEPEDKGIGIGETTASGRELLETRPHVSPLGDDMTGQGNAESPGSAGTSPYLPGTVCGRRRPAPRRPADPFPPDPFPLKSQLCQAGMIQWARERRIPMKFAFGFFDWQIVNGGVPMMH